MPRAATPSTGSLRIRKGVATDTPLILGFIRELAAYEKLRHEVRATVPLLRRSLFGRRKVAEVVIAEYAGEAVGFALFFHNFSTFLAKPGLYIEDLYVRETMRGKGVGRALLAHVAAIAKRRGCGRLEWWVLDWNQDAIGFYRNLGAVPMDEWTVFRVTGRALDRLARDGRR